jgi:hypothetical protein
MTTNDRKDNERETFEQYVRSEHDSEEYVTLVLQRNELDQYPVQWVNERWIGWLARANLGD